MRTGSLNKKVKFQELGTGTDDFGEPSKEWEDIEQPYQYVQIIPLNGAEKYQSKHLNAEVNHKIRMRHRAGLNSSMRVVYGERIFKVDAILNVYERDKELHIMVTEVI